MEERAQAEARAEMNKSVKAAKDFKGTSAEVDVLAELKITFMEINDGVEVETLR